MIRQHNISKLHRQFDLGLRVERLKYRGCVYICIAKVLYTHTQEEEEEEGCSLPPPPARAVRVSS